MNIQDLIPAHKGDDRGIERLKKLSFEEIQPIVPELLEWLQDVNWPIASDIADVLHPFVNRMVPEIIDIMKTNDGIWKYWILCTFGRDFKHPVLLQEIERIVRFPTEDEIAEEVNIIALEIMNGEYD
ncbi:DUF5071 domain-containing protein [Chitinophaga silvisoli]|uniref:DUF5071 domain-containing protein n=1 Tax=Chitinophaga silvisoli TaxID=2291814 RepID=A0A3E1P4M4_9BACT|nr:DUF5071 domain-containing protein [Chitinophaga silvisoli]RFM35149.1 DUF5071 domain-containing protein [Chitinophaga silvisoli]